MLLTIPKPEEFQSYTVALAYVVPGDVPFAAVPAVEKPLKVGSGMPQLVQPGCPGTGELEEAVQADPKFVPVQVFPAIACGAVATSKAPSNAPAIPDKCCVCVFMGVIFQVHAIGFSMATSTKKQLLGHVENLKYFQRVIAKSAFDFTKNVSKIDKESAWNGLCQGRVCSSFSASARASNSTEPSIAARSSSFASDLRPACASTDAR